MGGNHHGTAAAGHAGARYRRHLTLTFVMVLSFMLVELAAGLLSGSLALLSDAGHMSADVVALGAALVATRIAVRPDRTGQRTYGSYRAEVFASGFTVLIMLGVAVYVVIEGIGRVGENVEVQTTAMFTVGGLGLLVNLVSMWLLRGGATESLNVKGAYYEVVADAAGSVGVMVAGGLVLLTGDGVWDTVVAMAIGAFVAARAVVLGRQVLRVLAQHAPEGVSVERVVADLDAITGVADVHDLHLWTLTSGMNVATAHLVLEPGASPDVALRRAQALLADRHGIEHATLQTERGPTDQCRDITW